MSVTATNMRCLQVQMLRPRGETVVSSVHGCRALVMPVVLFLVLAVQLWLRVESISKGYEVEELRRVALRNDTELRELRLEYALLVRPGELAERARIKLGMTDLAPQRVRKLAQ